MNDNDNDDARRAILSRRAKFVAVAMAGTIVAACGKTEGGRGAPKGGDHNPLSCLSYVEPDAGHPRPPETATTKDAGTPQPRF